MYVLQYVHCGVSRVCSLTNGSEDLWDFLSYFFPHGVCSLFIFPANGTTFYATSKYLNKLFLCLVHVDMVVIQSLMLYFLSSEQT